MNNISAFEVLYNSVYPNQNIPENAVIRQKTAGGEDHLFWWVVGIVGGVVVAYCIMRVYDNTKEKSRIIKKYE